MSGIFISVAAHAASPQTRIAISPENGRVRVTYHLPAATRDFRLQLTKRVAPAANVAVEGNGLSLVDGQVTAAQPFTRFSLVISGDARDVDSTYPLMLPVGTNAAVVYAPHLLPASGAAQVKIAGPGGKLTRVSRKESTGYVIVGARREDHGHFRAVVASGVPRAVRETALSRASTLLAFYESRLKLAPGGRPTIVLSFPGRPTGATSNSFRGDVARNGVVFLRVYSDAAGAAAPAFVGRYTSFLSHELFHLWNRSADPESKNWWLHEGMAEYASWLATSTLWPDEGSIEKRIGSALQSCTMYLGGRPLAALPEIEARSVRYPCGAVVQWIADAGARAHSPGSDVFQVWRRLITIRNSAGSYTPAHFDAALKEFAPAARPAIAAIRLEPEVERWAKVARALNSMGSRVDVGRPAPFLLRLAATRPIVLSACGEVWGVGENDGNLFVQAPGACSTFGDSPVIEKVENLSPMENPLAFYETVRTACAERRSMKVEVTAKGGRRSHPITCTVDVSPPPPDLKIVRALPPQ